VALAAAALLGLGTRVDARVALVPSRAESLYSVAGTPDCTELSQRPDAALPMNVVRIRAVVDGAPADGVRYQWTMVGKTLGTLAADQPVGDGQQVPAVQGICAEFGNACVLTEDKLRFYTQPTILWLAPGVREAPREDAHARRPRQAARRGDRRPPPSRQGDRLALLRARRLRPAVRRRAGRR
jgi:hypothetical protein